MKQKGPGRLMVARQLKKAGQINQNGQSLPFIKPTTDVLKDFKMANDLATVD